MSAFHTSSSSQQAQASGFLKAEVEGKAPASLWGEMWEQLGLKAPLSLEEQSQQSLNKGYLCTDAHPPIVQQRTALIWVSPEGKEERYTFAELSRQSNRFANALTQLGVQAGERLFVFLERVPELYTSILGALKVGCLVTPVFSAFGPEALLDRLLDAEASVILTSPKLKPRLDEISGQVPSLKHILVLERGQTLQDSLKAGEACYETLMAPASDVFDTPFTEGTSGSVMHYTSGTTGKPKGAVHTHQAIVAQAATAKGVLDLKPETDIYWCTADPGWVTGTAYGLFGPWALGVTQLVYGGSFCAKTWYKLLQDYKVSVWYTAPTAIRMLMKFGTDLPQSYSYPSLRHLCSVGEPLNPEGITWGREVFGGLSFHDTWWQTETGAMHIVNLPSLPIKLGSMGKPLAGVQATVLDDRFEPLAADSNGDREGALALKSSAPSFFKTYWGQQAKYESRFKNGWYLTGDRAKIDADGYFWFIGREDDVINTAGHLVGPFEVESVLVEHPAVAEAGVIGIPDPERLEVIKAYISLKQGYEDSEALQKEIALFVRTRLAAHAYPRSIEVVASLPKTRSGKIMRRLLKARALGLPEGDTSTLEE
jgi:acetyl-CoA synthetase